MTKNPLAEKLQGYKIILASSSPRRQKFFKDLGLDFEIQVKSVEEVYPKHLKGYEISDYLAVLKAQAFEGSINFREIVITSDTVVWHKNKSLAKARDRNEAIKMLTILSGDWHEVITSVCFTTKNTQKVVNATTHVKFAELMEKEIKFYVEQYRPFDKAGAYGIQEWLGNIGIEKIKGSYNNVVGLPTHLVHKTLIDMVD